jgi:hypothetical protein
MKKYLVLANCGYVAIEKFSKYNKNEVTSVYAYNYKALEKKDKKGNYLNKKICNWIIETM